MKQIISKLMLLGSILVLAASFSACSKPKVALSLSKTQIKQGESVSVNWKSENSKEVDLNGQKVAKNGSQVFQPTQTTTYDLVGKKGDKSAKDSKTVTVEVLAAQPTISMTAEPAVINPGDKSILRWNSQNANSVDIPGLGSNLPASGERSVAPLNSTTYTATAKGAGGEGNASARVTVETATTTVDHTKDGNGRNVGTEFTGNVNSIYFDLDRSELRADAKTTLNSNASWLGRNENKDIKFRIEGNCDPRGSEEYNLGLGDKRANSAKTYLITQGVDPSRMDVISNGKRNATGTSEGSPNENPSWAHDRRAEFVYVSGGTSLKPAPAQQ